ncbi:alpha/beta hydrolase [Actinomadura opuntiae]|uniref:alpha/beta hydrolase n=1 Tax=Actinomadura sp. OS1-43 TaxID=604315 RepID=UPI00255A91C0|nr:alpha/beta hydrolase [Actinomadura sp. OS1-43]MDL4815624.1 alpha/beta hydrolase [Actinomadura sp. OS1-43]
MSALRDLIVAPHPDVAPLPDVAPPGVRVIRGVPYAELDGARPLEVDLWLPGGNAPLVLFLHGGAWRRGRRDDMGMRTRGWSPGPFARLAAAGFAVACADYRLSGEATFPAQLDDVRAALRWLVLRSAELGVDPGRIVVWGESAGGHLASLLALTSDEPRLAGAVVWYGPADLTLSPGPPESLLLGGDPADKARAAGPVAHVHAGAPPFLLVHGEDDTLVPCAHSQALAGRLREVGAPVDLRLVPSAEHGWHGVSDEVVESIFDVSLRFALDVSR